MKTYIIKKDKWYQTDYSIYRNNQLVGEIIPARFNQIHKLYIEGREYSLKLTNIWKNEKSLFLGDIKIASVFQKPFKNETHFQFPDNTIIIKSNIWKNKLTLVLNEKAIGDCSTKNFQSIITIGDDIKINYLAGLIFAFLNKQNAVIIIAVLIPIYVAAFS